MNADDFSIQAWLTQSNDLDIGFSSSTDVYHQIWASHSLTGSWSLIRGVTLGEDGVQVWTDEGVITSFSGLYYKMRRVPRNDPDDVDADGIDDVYELTRGFLDPMNAADGQEDEDGDGFDNQLEYLRESDPEAAGDPFDAATGLLDPDDDGYLNVYEYVHGSVTNDSDAVPAPSVYVDAQALPGGDGSPSSPYASISEAVDAAEPYAIIQLASGIYTGALNRNIGLADKALMLIGEDGPESCIIDCGEADRAFTVYSGAGRDTVIRGLTIQNGYDSYGGALYCAGGSPVVDSCVFRYCHADWRGGAVYGVNSNPVFRNCRFIANSAEREGGALYLYNAQPDIRHCTLLGNKAGMDGSALYCSSSDPVIRNCIVWGHGADSAMGGDAPVITYSCIEGGWTGEGNLDTDPVLTPMGRLTAGSSCIDAGAISSGVVRDVDGETRWDDPAHANAVSPADMGADEFVDTDADSLPDAWELRYLGDLAQDGTGDADTDGGPDGLDLSAEYENSTHPNRADTDADGIQDGAEVMTWGTSPIRSDTDDDDMPDAWELNNGLDPLVFTDRMQDSDGDGFGAVYEYIHGSDPNDAQSVPAPTLFADAAAPAAGDGSSDLPFNTIQAALDAASEYTIIQLADGVYRGAGNKDLDYNGQAVMVMSAGGAEWCVIDCEYDGRGVYFNDAEDDRAVLKGVTLRNGDERGGGVYCYSGSMPMILDCVMTGHNAYEGGGVYCYDAAPTLRNCLIIGNTNSQRGGGIYLYRSRPLIENCVIAENSVHYYGGGLYVRWQSRPDIRNCAIVDNVAQSEGGGMYSEHSTNMICNTILWGNSGGSCTGDTFMITYSDVAGGWPGDGNINSDPLLTQNRRHLPAGSPCIDAGTLTNAPMLDRNGEARWDDPAHANAISIVDIGPDEFVDTDADALADHWEMRYFGSLDHNGTMDDDPGGGDGLDHLAEYTWSTDPCNADTDGDGADDGTEVLVNGTDALCPDTDGDGMYDGWEIAYSLDPLDSSDRMQDSDGDGYGAVYEFIHGSDPQSTSNVPMASLYIDASAAAGGDGTPALPFNIIQDALDAAQAYDILQLADGVYSGAGNVELNLQGKPITVQSENGPDACVIDGGNAARGCVFQSGEDQRTILRGLTFRHCYHSGDGGALYCSGAGPVLRNCVFTENASGNGGGMYVQNYGRLRLDDCLIVSNTASSGGGGVYVYQGWIELQECRLTDNQAAGSGGAVLGNSRSDILLLNSQITGNSASGSGGGLCGMACTVTLARCTFTDNEASYDGGALYCSQAALDMQQCMVQSNRSDGDSGGGMYLQYTSDALIKDSLWAYNQARNGGALYNYNADPTMINCTLHGNRADSSYYCGGIYNASGSDPVLRNCILWTNTGSGMQMAGGSPQVTYSVVQNGYTGAGNSSSNPLLYADTYHLCPDSPCIDAGTDAQAASTDLHGNPRTDDPDHGNVISIVDIGAEEYTDADADGLPEWWEMAAFGDLTRTGSGDEDADGLDNRGELEAQTDPHAVDTDSDGLTDGEEVLVYGTRPLDPDSDDDTMTDQWEVSYGLDPLNAANQYADTDGDRYADPFEFVHASNPSDAQEVPAAGLFVAADAAPGGDGSQAAPFDSLSNAVAAASAYDIIQVADGTYRGAANRGISFGGMPLMMCSTNGPEACVVDCEYGDRGFLFEDGEDIRSVLWGITIRNGYAYRGGGLCCLNAAVRLYDCVFTGNRMEDEGGGLYISGGDKMVLEDCVFSDNGGHEYDIYGGGLSIHGGSVTMRCCRILANNSWSGGGIALYNTDPVLTDCRISENTAERLGGALYLRNSLPKLEQCRVRRNTAEQGGGLYLSESDPAIRNSLLAENTADEEGGAVHLYEASPSFINCTIVSNTASSGSALYCDSTDSKPVVRNCIVWNNGSEIVNGDVTLDYTCLEEGGLWGIPWNSWSFPLAAYYKDARTQVIYPAEEIGCSGTVQSVALKLESLPTATLPEFTIRMKHTSLSNYTAAAWQTSGWSVVYQATENFTETGWVTFECTTPFSYNADSNLMVDISFHDSNYGNAGSVRVRDDTDYRTVYGGTDGASDDPVDWSGTSPSAGLSAQVPILRLDIDGVPVTAGVVSPDGVMEQEPALTAQYNLLSDSPCIDAGTTNGAPLQDRDGEARWDDPAHANLVSPVDMGWDEFVDTDADSLPDAWEQSCLGGLSQGPDQDADGDTLLNALEYQTGTHPGRVDTDDDGLSDADEIQVYLTSPLHADTDEDGMPDGWEISFGLDPLDAWDQALDADGDRYANRYEYIYQTSPANATSCPSPTLFVDAAAPAGGDGSAGAPYTTLAAALNAAALYDIIHVADGTYTGSGNRNLDFHGKPVLLMSVNGPADCVIDSGSWDRGFVFTTRETPASIVCGFTVCNVRRTDSGGAVWCERASPSFQYCVIADNEASDGAGVFLRDSSSVFLECTFTNNRTVGSGGYGGGVYAMSSGRPVFHHCRFMDNRADSRGGGIYVHAIPVTLRHCVIRGNEAVDGGGGYMASSSGTDIDNCTFRGNTATDYGSGGGLYLTKTTMDFGNCIWTENAAYEGGALHITSDGSGTVRIRNCVLIGNTADYQGAIQHLSGEAILRNCIVRDNGENALAASSLDVAYCNVEGGYAGTDNMDADPCCRPDYRLCASSPCIDAGTDAGVPDLDIDGEPRWDDPAHVNGPSVVDIGIDEFIDTDGDALPDHWENKWWGSLQPQADGDADGDGLTNITEYVYITAPLNPDTDDDGLQDGEEVYVFQTSPFRADTDGDGLPDLWEVMYGVDPLDAGDVMADTDGDGYGGIYEYIHGTIPTNRASMPTSTLFVAWDAVVGGTGTRERPYRLIQDALNAAGTYDLVEVADGEYSGPGNCNLSFDGVAMMLLSTGGAANCVIDGGTSARAFTFTSGEDQRSAVRGFTMRNGQAGQGGAVYCRQAGPSFGCCRIEQNRATEHGGGIYLEASSARLSRCLITANTADDDGAGLCVEQGAPVLNNCVIADNAAARDGGGLMLSDSAAPVLWNCTVVGNRAGAGGGWHSVSGTATLRNAIVWGNIPDAFSGQAPDIAYSDIQGGASGTGNLNADPLLRAEYRLAAASPCIDAGCVTNAPGTDREGECRWDDPAHANDPSHVDMGADEWVDTDADNLPDRWEQTYWGSLSQHGNDDPDGDGLTNREEYDYRTNPTRTSSDDDSLSDGEERDVTGTSPLLADTDADGLPDDWEYRHALDPLNPDNGMADADDDGFANLYEYQHGADPTQALDRPPVSLYVDASVTPGGNGTPAYPYHSVMDAVRAAEPFDIIQLADGVYQGAENRDIDFDGKILMLMSAHGAGECVIDCGGVGRAFLFTEDVDGQTVLDGLTIRNGAATSGGGICCSGGDPLIRNIRITACRADAEGGAVYLNQSAARLHNCMLYGNRADLYGGALAVMASTARIQNCTIVDNRAPAGGGIYAGADGCPVLCNTIVWNNEAGAVTGGSPIVSYSVVQGGWSGTGNLNTNPLLTCAYNLQPGSPCIDAGTESNAPAKDIYGVIRQDDPLHPNVISVVDIGADEYEDTDADALSDDWERCYFGDLAQTGSQDNDVQGGSDGLSNLEEMILGTDPTAADSDGDGLLDGEEVNLYGTDPLCADSDGDALPDQWEQQAGLDPLDAGDVMRDPDADGFGNAYEYAHGTDPYDENAVPPITLYVSASAPVGGNGTAAAPLRTIQQAVNQSPEYGIIEVADGYYIGAGNRDIRLNGKVLMLQSALGPTQCVIDAEGVAGGLNVIDGEDRRTVIRGFTVCNGAASSGAGIRCMDSSPTVRDCIIVENTASSCGGGIYVEKGSPRFVNCRVGRNASDAPGGGWYIDRAEPILEQCRISENTAQYAGGGMYMQNATAQVYACTFADNAVAYTFGGYDATGGGLSMYGDTCSRFSNCVFSGNTAAGDGGGLYIDGGTPELVSCIVTANQAGGSGGGISMSYAEPVFRKCRVAGNEALQDGGGCCCTESDPAFYNCILDANSARVNGGGLYGSYSDALIQNCVVADNGALAGGGVYGINGTPVFRNSIAWGNTPDALDGAVNATWSVVEGGAPGEGNQSDDPQLTESFRLRYTSPCIDAGTTAGAPSADLEGEARRDDPLHDNVISVVDIGADEFVDTDADDLPDRWELEKLGDLDRTGDADADGDGLCNRDEYARSTNPGQVDTDQDGLTDAEEVNTCGTDPLRPDTDDDGMPDGWETGFSLDPLDAADRLDDPDGDGFPNRYEYHQDTSPTNQAERPAADWFVAADAAPQGDGSDASPFARIQSALNVAAAYDIIQLADGQYRGPGNRDLDAQGKTIMLMATSGPAACIVDAGLAGRGMVFTSGEGADTILYGITIQNGSAELGGGLYCNGAGPTIWNCRLLDNTAAGGATSGQGGGLYAASGTPVIRDCTFVNNTAAYGGGLFASTSEPVLRRTWFRRNTAVEGAAVYLQTSSPTVVENCMLQENTATTCGGGMVLSASSPTLFNCTILCNAAPAGGGIYCDAPACAPVLRNCILWSNGTEVTGGAVDMDFACVQGGDTGGGGDTIPWNYPLATYYHDARTQVIYPAGEIGTSGDIQSLALDVSTVPAQTLNAFTLRMKHTDPAVYDSPAWDDSGWTVVYQATETINNTGWVTFDFPTPFAYSADANLMVDISFNNSSWSSDGQVMAYDTGNARSLYFRTDSGYGDPLNWSGTSPYPGSATLVPVLKLDIDGSMVIAGLPSSATIIDADPLLTRNGTLRPSSPCIDAGTSNGAPPRDKDREDRWDDPDRPNGESIVDIGWDEWVDTDGDDLPDRFEQQYGLSDPGGDADGDTLTNLEEYERGLDPLDSDSDNDGLSDAVETHTGVYVSTDDTGTDPLTPDTDGDGVADGDEVMDGTNPLLNLDTDGDGYSDAYEDAFGTEADNAAHFPATIAGWITYDGRLTGQVYAVAALHSNNWDSPYAADLSSPGRFEIIAPTLTSYWIRVYRDTDGDQVPGALEAWGAYAADAVYLTGSLNADMVLADVNADQDDLPDWWEWEQFAGTAPYGLEDTDQDGFVNRYEYQHRSDPADAASRPEPTLYVDGAMLSDPSARRFATLSEAVSRAMPFDIIEVAEYAYRGAGNRDLSFGGRPLMLTAEGRPEATVIDCEGAGRGFVFTQGENAYSMLRGLTVINGQAGYGGGLYCHNADPTVEQCIFRDNVAMEMGGGVYCWSSNPSFFNCTLSANAAAYGGGVFCKGGAPLFRNCTIADNTEGGLYGNRNSTAEVVNCVLWGNEPTQIKNGHPDVSYCCVQGHFTGFGIINGDPEFVAAEAGDYHLRLTSPCVDAGVSNVAVCRDVDRDGESRWDAPASNRFSFVDMGADEVHDEDADTLADSWEIRCFGDIAQQDAAQDPDADGWSNAEEHAWGTDPVNGLTDRDTDGMPDEWEYFNFGHRDQDAVTDADGDQVPDAVEYSQSTDPLQTLDTDADGMPDDWEIRFFGDTAATDGTTDADGDGLNDGDEFDHQCDPLITDSDGDGLGDGDEVQQYGTDPACTDSDGDTMPDGWEASCGLDPADPADMMSDPDADGYGNIYEYQHGTQATNPYSQPEISCFVNLNIQDALTAAQPYDIIEVRSGIYTGAVNRQLDFMGKPLMLVSESGAASCVIDCGGKDVAFRFDDNEDARSVVRGFTLRRGRAAAAGAVLCQGSGPAIEHCILVSNGVASLPAVACYSAAPVLRHCTIAGNNGPGIYCDGAAAPELLNCIVWGNDGAAFMGDVPSVAYSCIEGGVSGPGNLWADPAFRALRRGDVHLDAGSPCIDAGCPAGTAPDMDGEFVWDDPARSNAVGPVDIGADEYVDADADDMADWWEFRYWGNLSHTGENDTDTVGGRDGLSDRAEYQQGTDPDVADSDNDGIYDGDEDGDADGLNAAGEQACGTALGHPDSDGDGFSDGEEVTAGTDPLSAAQTPDATTVPGGVVINRLCCHDRYGCSFIELFNTSTAAVDISAYTLHSGIYRTWTNVVIPSNTVIASNDFFLIGDPGVRDVMDCLPDLVVPFDPYEPGSGTYAVVMLLQDSTGASVDSVLYGQTISDSINDYVDSAFLIPPVPNPEPGSALARVNAGRDTDQPKDWCVRPVPAPKSSAAAPAAPDDDFDGDGVTDQQELQQGMDLQSPDSDGDGISDGAEIAQGTDPVRMDSDGDGLTDDEEQMLGTDPADRDSDGDGLWDSTEIRLFLNPSLADTDGNGVDDAYEDSDGDGFGNGAEQGAGYDPGSEASSPANGDAGAFWADGSVQWEVPLRVWEDYNGTHEERLRPYDKVTYDKQVLPGRTNFTRHYKQDFVREHIFKFFNVLDSIPVYFVITHHPGRPYDGRLNDHFDYSVEGAGLVMSSSNSMIYGTRIPSAGKTVRVKEILKQMRKKCSDDTIYKWPHIAVSTPVPLYVNGSGPYRVAPTNKETIGLFVPWNDDDDDGDEIPDYQDDYVIVTNGAGDDDLIPVRLQHPDHCPVSLEYDESIIRLYEHPKKKLWGGVYNAEVGACTRKTPYSGYDDNIVYVEGIAPGTTWLKITGPGGYSDKIKICVIELQLFRDEACTLPLEDWPAESDLARSPKCLFREDDRIFLKISNPSPGLGDNFFRVQVTSETDTSGIEIGLSDTDEGYINTMDPLGLGLETSMGAVDRIQVYEEEVLSFSLLVNGGYTASETDVMVDRGEYGRVKGCPEGDDQSADWDARLLDVKQAIDIDIGWMDDSRCVGGTVADVQSAVSHTDAGQSDFMFVLSHGGFGSSAYEYDLSLNDVRGGVDFLYAPGQQPVGNNTEIHPEDHWNEDVEWAWFDACTVLGIPPDELCDEVLIPWIGLHAWDNVLMNRPRQMHALMGYSWIVRTAGDEVVDDFFEDLANGQTIVDAYVEANINYNWQGYDAPYVIIVNSDNVNDTIEMVTRDSSNAAVIVYWGDVDFSISVDQEEIAAYDPRAKVPDQSAWRQKTLPEKVIRGSHVRQILGDTGRLFQQSGSLSRGVKSQMLTAKKEDVSTLAQESGRIFAEFTGMKLPDTATCCSILTMYETTGMHTRNTEIVEHNVAGRIVRFRNYLGDIPVEGDFIRVRVDQSGKGTIHAAWHSVQQTTNLPHRAICSAAEAVAAARDKDRSLSDEDFRFGRLVYMRTPAGQLVPKWKFIIKGQYEMYVDAIKTSKANP